MAEGKSPGPREAHMIFSSKEAPKYVRVNLADGTPKDIARDDPDEMAAHGLVLCPNCKAPNHAMQLSESEQPWIQCGCRGMRVEVALSRKGREHVKFVREAMIERVNSGRGVVSRG